MFEPIKIKKWECKDPKKIVQARYMNVNYQNMLEARFTLDEIAEIKERVGDWYFVKFKNDKEEYALPKSIIEENFVMEVE